MRRFGRACVALCSGWAQWAAVIILCGVVWRLGARHDLVLAGEVMFAGLGLLAVVRGVSKYVTATGRLADRVVILGTGRLAATIVHEAEGRAKGTYTVAGIVEEGRRAGRRIEGATRLGTLDALDEILEEVQPTRIVIALQDSTRRVPHELLLEARVQGIGVEEAATFVERVLGRIAIEALSPRSLVLSEGFRHCDLARHSGLTRLVTRALSVCGAALTLVVLAPLLGLIALAIKIDTPGPIFFVQKRVGRNGRPFGLVKFRTMRVATGRVSEWVKDNADRITRIGKWLRRFRLDELPQCMNVLRGEMNLVGPRPHPTCNYELFLDRIPYYGLRASVRPGITGWAQVRYGYANSLDEESEKMSYDLYYIKHRSLWLDVRIILDTVGVLVDGRSHDAPERHAPARGWRGSWSRSTSGLTSR